MSIVIFKIISSLYLIFRFLEYFSLMLTAWIMQVSVQVTVNQPLSDRWPQYIDWLNYLQWVDLRIFISPEWLFTGGKQRFTKAALWINPPSRKSHQRLVMTSGLWHPERKNTDPDPDPDPGPAPWVSHWRNEPWTNDIDLIWQLSGPISPLKSRLRCLCSTCYTVQRENRFSGKRVCNSWISEHSGAQLLFKSPAQMYCIRFYTEICF